MSSSPAAITVHGQQPSRPDATPVLSHRPPPPTRTHHEPPPRSWSTARAQCQRDTGSATSTTISPHNSESATLDPTPRPPVRDPPSAIHGAATEALDLRGDLDIGSHSDSDVELIPEFRGAAVARKEEQVVL
ncbi:unnamed protein product [Pleuronectes platessa]|uniref:Uncharacterized protein n=1 Tax=Pleuronectes platessa TaxID=8262 RepID=A0A9N7V4M0_PLEPL|nr:unnamed protein product [Pleuronectes platessa]